MEVSTDSKSSRVWDMPSTEYSSLLQYGIDLIWVGRRPATPTDSIAHPRSPPKLIAVNEIERALPRPPPMQTCSRSVFCNAIPTRTNPRSRLGGGRLPVSLRSSNVSGTALPPRW